MKRPSFSGFLRSNELVETEKIATEVMLNLILQRANKETNFIESLLQVHL